jgi:hypothetical protein
LSIAEVVLLAIGISEDVIPQEIDEQDTQDTEKAEFDMVEGEITGLKSVNERNKCEVADSKHESETITCDVHRREQCGL